MKKAAYVFAVLLAFGPITYFAVQVRSKGPKVKTEEVTVTTLDGKLVSKVRVRTETIDP